MLSQRMLHIRIVDCCCQNLLQKLKSENRPKEKEAISEQWYRLRDFKRMNINSNHRFYLFLYFGMLQGLYNYNPLHIFMSPNKS